MRIEIYEQQYTQKVNNFNTAIADGDFPASGSYIDVSEFLTFAFEVYIGTLNSALTAQVQQATAADGVTKNVTSAVAVIAADDDDEWVTIQVDAEQLDIANGYQYVTLDLSGAAGSDDYLCIVFKGLIPRHVPVTQPAGYSQNIYIAG